MERPSGAAPAGGSAAQDELQHGPDRVPRRLPRRVRLGLDVGVIAAAVLLAGTQLVGGERPLLAPGPEVAVGAVGPPEDACVHTDHRSWLEVSFVLANTGNVPVSLRRVRATLPASGLRLTDTSVSGGTCSRLGEPMHSRLEVGASLLVTLAFRLSAACPQPIPMEATLTVETDNGRRSTHVVPVLQDLGQVPLVQCHPAATAQPTAVSAQANGQRREPGGTRTIQCSGPRPKAAIRCPAHGTTPSAPAAGQPPARVGP